MLPLQATPKTATIRIAQQCTHLSSVLLSPSYRGMEDIKRGSGVET